MAKDDVIIYIGKGDVKACLHFYWPLTTKINCHKGIKTH